MLPHLCRLQPLHSCGTLKIYLLCLPQPSSSSPPLTRLMLALRPPDMPPTLPPISTLITPYASTPRRSQSICSRGALSPPYASSSSAITILMLSQCPPKMPPMLLPHLPNLQRHLPSLNSCNTLKMRLQCPPISSLTTPYASAPLPLTILTFLRHPQDMLLMPPLSLILSPPLTILMLRYGGLLA
ncbi:hypothetical protein O181_115144 [Austropuccinia psidii MF-1]|uniref:Uncharacterized protein n=1 Tax=Austropuccinia psidii MF-1 TaxID=1389203 RepID=A0A9Q3K6J9_9BASI|nr:hypothetical protein [Austropuccinia psidii MF-1]